MPQDLIVLTISGVQRFISESRSTSDLAAASMIIRQLGKAAASSLKDSGAELIFPHESVLDEAEEANPPTPNRIVALIAEGSGATAARSADHAVKAHWEQIVQESIGTDKNLRALSFRSGPQSERVSVEEATRGFPSVHWVVVDPRDTYLDQWNEAGKLLASVKQAAPFTQFGNGAGLERISICQLSPRWPALGNKPKKATKMAKGDLSAANWVKNVYAKESSSASSSSPDDPPQDVLRFPSTRGVASAFIRQELIDKVADSVQNASLDTPLFDDVKKLHALSQQIDRSLEAAPGGMSWRTGDADLDRYTEWLARGSAQWLDPEQWNLARLNRQYPNHKLKENDIARGAQLAAKVKRDLKAHDSRYLAIIVQDLDSLGSQLSEGPDASGAVSPEWHRNVSKRLSELASKYHEILKTNELLATPVYAGGDDLLFLAPAKSAFEAARAAHEAACTAAREVGLRSTPTASTAIVFFHHSTPFTGVVQMAHDLLPRTKARVLKKNSLGVIFMSHSGSSREALLPWDMSGISSDNCDITEVLSRFTRKDSRILSPRLAAEVERDKTQLQSIIRDYPELYRAEISRLVRRHATEKETHPDELLANLERLTMALQSRRNYEAEERLEGNSVTFFVEALKLAHSISKEAR